MVLRLFIWPVESYLARNLAALWSRHKPHCGDRTTTPNETVSPYHHRMPFLLHHDQWEIWLGNPKSKLRDQFHEVMRFKHFSQRTDESAGRLKIKAPAQARFDLSGDDGRRAGQDGRQAQRGREMPDG